METKFSKSVPASVGRSDESNGSVEVDTFLWFPEIFLELVNSPSQCVGLTNEQARELGEALIGAADYREEVARDH